MPTSPKTLCPQCGGARTVSLIEDHPAFLLNSAEQREHMSRRIAAPRIHCPTCKAAGIPVYPWDVARVAADAERVAASKVAA